MQEEKFFGARKTSKPVLPASGGNWSSRFLNEQNSCRLAVRHFNIQVATMSDRETSRDEIPQPTAMPDHTEAILLVSGWSFLLQQTKMQRFEGNREGSSEKRLERTLGFDEYRKSVERRWLA